MYGSLTTKKLKKKHSFRPVGEVETGSQGGEDAARWQLGNGQAGKVVAGGPGGPIFACR